ncbi:MAG: hypothetical protein H0V84_01905 [Actinobacteria bacterium]|nr:hypothetical protein [Actinomycetota bacterium]
MVGEAEDRLREAEALLERLERARARLEATEDPDAAIDVLAELSEIAKEIELAIGDARKAVDAEP